MPRSPSLLLAVLICAAPLVLPGTETSPPAGVEGAHGRPAAALARILERRISLNLSRTLLWEALSEIEFRTGLPYSAPNPRFSLGAGPAFDCNAVDAPVAVVLDRIATASGTEWSCDGERIVIWNRAPEGRLAELIALMRDGPDLGTRILAAHDLAQLGDRRCVPPLYAAISDPDVTMAAMAMRALTVLQGNLASVPGFPVEAVLARLPDRRLRADACRLLGSTADPRATEALLTALSDGEGRTRDCATMALAHHRDPRVLDALLARFSGRSGDDLILLVCSLTELNDQRVADALIARITDPDPNLSDLIPCCLGQLRLEGLVPRLIALLDSPDQRLRLAAAIALGPQRDPRAVEALLRQLGDPDAGNSVRAEAVSALCQIGDPAAIDPLLGMLGHEEWIFDYALSHLPVFGPSVADRLITRLGDGDPGIRADAATVLAGFHDPRTVTPLSALIGDPETRVRSAALSALGKSRLAAARELLLLIGNSGEAGLRRTAIDALAQLRDPAADADLARFLASDDKDLRSAAAGAFTAGFNSSRCLPELAARLADPEPDIAHLAAYALVYQDDPRTIAPLLACLSSGNDLSESACSALMQNVYVVNVVLPRLHDPKPKVRAYAVSILDNMPDLRVAEPLLRLFSDSREPITAEMVGRLINQHDPRFVEPLCALAGSPDSEMRSKAAQVLGEMGDVRAWEALSTLLDDPEPRVVEIAGKALDRLPDPRTHDRVAAMLRSGDVATQRSGILALRHLGDAPLRRLRAGLLADADPGRRGLALAGYIEAPDPIALEGLIACAADPVSANRVAVAEALGKLGDARAAASLSLLSRDGEPAVAAAATSALGCIRDPTALKQLLALSHATDAAIRTKAVESLGQHGGPAAIDRLLALLNDGESYSAVKDALYAIYRDRSDPRIIDGLLTRIVGQDRGIRDRAVTVLGYIKPHKAVMPLIGLTTHSDPRVRAAVARVLVLIEDHRIGPALETLLQDPDPSVAQECRQAMENPFAGN